MNAAASVHPHAPGSDDGPDPFARATVTREDRGRTLPHNFAAEQSVLGGILIRNELRREIHLEPSDFYDPRHGVVWAAMAELDAEEIAIDVLTLEEQLRAMGRLDAAGGAGYLGELELRVPTSDNTLHYAEIVAGHAQKRRTAQALSEAAAQALEPHADVDVVIGQVQATLSDIRERAAAAAGIDATFGGDLRAFLGDDEPDDDPSRDYVMHGIIPRGAPFVIGGHPKQGKTLLVESLAIAIASGAADWCGFPISPDMRGGRVLLLPREDSITETRVRLWRLARGLYIDPRSLTGRLEVDPSSTLYLDDDGLVAKLRRSAELFDVMLIDSLQTIHRGDENSARDMAVVLGAWRDIALGTGKAIGLVHHYNGKGAEGDTRDPGHKLRGSSAIFATARHVVGVERMKKPEGAIAVRVSGNLSHTPEPFAVRRVESRLASGRLAWGYEPIGKLGELRDTEVADAILGALAAAGETGLGTRALREQVRERVETRNEDIASELRALSRQRAIARGTSRSPWRLAEVKP